MCQNLSAMKKLIVLAAISLSACAAQTAPQPAKGGGDLEALREQMSEMQRKLDELRK